MSDGGDDEDLSAEWRRLRRAGLFFAVSLMMFLALAGIGLFH